MDKGLSITNYAKGQGVDRSTVHRWINEGRLEYYLTPSKLKRITGIKIIKDCSTCKETFTGCGDNNSTPCDNWNN
jgi:predicted site-specific integrase-resolvase